MHARLSEKFFRKKYNYFAKPPFYHHAIFFGCYYFVNYNYLCAIRRDNHIKTPTGEARDTFVNI